MTATPIPRWSLKIVIPNTISHQVLLPVKLISSLLLMLVSTCVTQAAGHDFVKNQDAPQTASAALVNAEPEMVGPASARLTDENR